jgi:mannitol-1-phosphate/altronate dehydrogenase
MTPKEYADKLIKLFSNTLMADNDLVFRVALNHSVKTVEEMLNNELLTDLLQLPDDSPHKYKAIYQKMWLTDVKNELLKQQNNG